MKILIKEYYFQIGRGVWGETFPKNQIPQSPKSNPKREVGRKGGKEERKKGRGRLSLTQREITFTYACAREGYFERRWTVTSGTERPLSDISCLATLIVSTAETSEGK